MGARVELSLLRGQVGCKKKDSQGIPAIKVHVEVRIDREQNEQLGVNRCHVWK